MAWVAVALAVVSAVRSVVAGNQAAKAAKSQANYQADLTRSVAERNAQSVEAQAAEESRRLFENQLRAKSAARARSLASGIDLEGSPTIYMDEMDRVYGEDLDWRRKIAANNAAGIRWEGEVRGDFTEWQGRLQAQQAKAAGWTAAIGSLGKAAGGISGMMGGAEAPTVGGPTSSFNLSMDRGSSFGLSTSSGSGFGLKPTSNWWGT